MNLYESLEKNLEVVWKNEGHISSAQLPQNTKNDHFLTTDHRNVVRENFFRDFGDVTLVQNLFKPIRAINRTNSKPIWPLTCEDIDHIAKRS